MATTTASAAASSPNGLGHSNNSNGNSHCATNGSTSFGITSHSPLATPTTPNNTQHPQSQQQQPTHNLQRQLLQLKLQQQLQQLPTLDSTPRSSHSNTPPSLPSISQTLPQLNNSSTTNNNTPRHLHIQSHQSQSLPLHYNQYTPNTITNDNNNNTSKKQSLLLPSSPYHPISKNGYVTTTTSSTISTPRSGSLLGPSTPSFKLNSPSPTTSTFATSFPSTISQQSAANLNPQDYDFIFDVRPFNLYSKSRIIKSTNLCLPTTLLKRNSMSLIDLINMVDLSSELKDVFTKHLQKDHLDELTKLSILVYDQCSSNEAITFPCIRQFQNLKNTMTSSIFTISMVDFPVLYYKILELSKLVHSARMEVVVMVIMALALMGIAKLKAYQDLHYLQRPISRLNLFSLSKE